MQSSRGTVGLLVFCVILGVVAVVYVVRSDDPVVTKRTTELARMVVAEDGVPSSVPASVQAAAQEGKPNPDPYLSFKRDGKPVPAAPAPQEDLETTEKPNPKLVVPPVDEPVMPLDEKAGEKFNYLPLPNSGGFIFERLDAGGKPVGGVVVPGHVLVRRGIIELFGCAESGKVHETVVQIETDIQSLDTALTLAGLRRGRIPRSFGVEDPKQGSRVIVLIQWEDKDGKTVTHRSEDLVVSLKREAPMPRVGWTYVGQWTEVIDPTTPTLERRHKVLACTGTRSLVTTFRDKTSLLDNPLPEAEDDTQYASNYMLLPMSGTPIRVIFRPPTAAELKEIAAIEAEVAKAPVKWKPDDREHEHEGGAPSYYKNKGPGGTPLPEQKNEEKKEP